MKRRLNERNSKSEMRSYTPVTGVGCAVYTVEVILSVGDAKGALERVIDEANGYGAAAVVDVMLIRESIDEAAKIMATRAVEYT